MRDGAGKAVRVGDDPVSQKAAAAASGHSHMLFVDVSATEFVHASHQIFEIVPGIMVLDDVSKRFVVGSASARIGIENHVSLGCHPLHFVKKYVAIGLVRASVNVKDERIFLVRVEVGGFCTQV